MTRDCAAAVPVPLHAERNDPELRAEVIRQAARTAADVVVVTDHDGLLALGGLGATLRYRVPTAPAEGLPA